MKHNYPVVPICGLFPLHAEHASGYYSTIGECKTTLLLSCYHCQGLVPNVTQSAGLASAAVAEGNSEPAGTTGIAVVLAKRPRGITGILVPLLHPRVYKQSVLSSCSTIPGPATCRKRPRRYEHTQLRVLRQLFLPSGPYPAVGGANFSLPATARAAGPLPCRCRAVREAGGRCGRA